MMTLEVGALLHNRYRVEATIAVGGMGAVYRALDETLGIQVAVKENFFSTEEYSRQFRREATILASLRHPNLPRVTDHFVIPAQGQYLVMDFIEGVDLREIIAQNGSLAEAEIIRIGAIISDALAYLHSRNPAIVHRDIKPGNLKITPAGNVFLVDFGLAKISRGEATATGAQALTPGYAPPEQYGQGTEPRSDIYALGATLYAALTGKIPEDGLSRAMGSAELTPVRKHNPQVTERLAKVIEHAMAIVPADRYATAMAFREGLLSAEARSQVKAQPVSVPTLRSPFPRPVEQKDQSQAAALPGPAAPVIATAAPRRTSFQTAFIGSPKTAQARRANRGSIWHRRGGSAGWICHAGVWPGFIQIPNASPTGSQRNAAAHAIQLANNHPSGPRQPHSHAANFRNTHSCACSIFHTGRHGHACRYGYCTHPPQPL